MDNPVIDYKPSAVYLGVPPLVGTMQKSEIEACVAVYVRACQALGDEWKPLAWEDIGAVLKKDMEDKREPFAKLVSNPFFRPDVWKAISEGFAKWHDKEDGSIVLTDKAFEAMRKHVHAV